VMEAAHSLGRGEARVGRTMTALLAAYRVGARIAWQEQSAVLVRFDVPATSVAQYAQLVFEYIDELSSSSAAGHQEQLSTSGRVREQLLERLSIGIVTGEPAAELERLAHRADWELPDTLTVVVLRSAHAAAAVSLLDTRTLRLSGSLAPGIDDDDLAVLLVTDAHRSRPALIAALVGRGATVGPSKAWLDATDSFDRVVRALRALPHTERDQPIDTDHHLATLVLHADPVALDDLRARVLQPLMDLTPSTADRLTETLESWLLHQGRRSEVAADLHVHPQTVRYRMNQLRELFGGRIDHPDTVRELIIALTAHREDASSR